MPTDRSPAADPAPHILKTIVDMMRGSTSPMWLAWGPAHSFFCNDACRDTLGLPPAVPGAPASQVWSALWTEIEPRIAQVLAHGEAASDRVSLQWPTRSGIVEETFHRFSYSPVPGDDGEVQGVLCVATDETTRVLGARRLASLGALLAAAGGTASIDTNAQQAMRALAVNRNDLPFGALYLLTPDAASARLAASFGDVAPDAQIRLDEPGSIWPLAEVMTSGKPARTEHALVMPLAQADGGHAAFGGLILGISPRLHFDDGYRGYLLLVAAQVASRLAVARAREAESANRTKDEFLAVLGHELRNPLAPIVTALHLLQVRGIDGITREQQILDRQVGRLVGLADELLDVSRILGGTLSLQMLPVSLTHAVSHALAATAPRFEQKHQHVSVDVPASGLEVLADGARLTQIIATLLTHAAACTPAEGQVRIGARFIDGTIALVVEHDGAGMGADEMSRVFETAIRPLPGSDHAGGHLGFGLAVARSLARQQGGDITAASDGAERGSRFTLTLPALVGAR